MTADGSPVLDERALQGRRLQVRAIRPEEATRLVALRDRRNTAIREYADEIVRLYEAGVSTTSIGQAIDLSRQNVCQMLRRRRRWRL